MLWEARMRGSGRFATTMLVAGALALAGCDAVDDLAGGAGGGGDLSVGDCFDATGLSTDGTAADSIEPTVVDCANGHDAQAFASIAIEAESYPSDLNEQGSERCFDEFEGFVGVPFSDSMYGFDWLYPSEAAWDAGEHEILCYLESFEGGQIEGDAEGSGN